MFSCWVSVIHWPGLSLTFSPSFSFKTGIFTLCHQTLEECNRFTDFTGTQIEETALSFKGDFMFLNSVETAGVMGSFEVGINAFCIMR